MKKYTFTILSLILSVIVIHCGGRKDIKDDALSITPETANLKILWQGQKQNAEFSLVNHSEKTFEVTNIVLACGCTTVDLPKGRKIQPQETVKFASQLVPSETIEPVEKLIEIQLKDEKDNIYKEQCRIRYRGLRPLTCSPASILIRNYPINQPWEETVAIHSLTADMIQSVSFESSSDEISVEKIGMDEKSKIPQYLIKVSSKGFAENAIKQSIIIHDGRLDSNDVPLPIIGNTVPEFEAVPSSLHVKKEDYESGKEITLRIQSHIGEPFVIEKIATESGAFEASALEKTMAKEQSFRLTPLKGSKIDESMNVKTIATLKTGGNQERTIEIPVFIR